MPWRTAAAAGLLALLLLGAPSDARKSTTKYSMKSKRSAAGGAGSGPAPVAAGQLRHLMEEAEKALGAGEKVYPRAVPSRKPRIPLTEDTY